MIHVVATICVETGKRDEFLEIFRGIVGDVRAENGCIEYGPAIDIDADLAAQPAVRLNAVVVIEKWESLDALKSHLVAPHMVAYKEKVKDLVRDVELRVFESA